MARIQDVKDVDVFENGRVIYSNNVRLNKRGRNAERTINRRVWKRTYKDSRFMNHPQIRERTYSRMHSSSYWFDFTMNSFRSIVVVLLLFIGFYMVIFSDDIASLNPFESGISILQEISDMGESARDNMYNFFKSIRVLVGQEDILPGPLFDNVLTRFLTSVVYSLGAIFNFIKFIFQIILLILRIFIGAL